jgi:hypothetical protein
MSTKAGTIGVPARSTRFPLWAVAVSGLAVAALIMSAVALGLAVRADEGSGLPAPRKAIEQAHEATRPALLEIYSGSAITGTGPGLIEEARTPRTAALLRTYSDSIVTGTGPGLADVAFDHQVPQVTGTGPGLVRAAEHSRGR